MLLCVLTLSFFSCSTENNDATTTENAASTSSAFQLKSLSTTDLGTAKQLYIDMMGTQKYSDYKSALAAFTDKLGLNKITGTTKIEWMSWINNNLNKTSFTSVTEFESMYDDSVNKLSIMIGANTALYDYMSKADVYQIGIILQPEHDNHTVDYPVQTNSCLDDCISICDSAQDVLQDQYDQNVQFAASAGYDSGLMIGAEVNYNSAYIELALEFNSCAGAC
ncbi:hypothetical protein DVK85_12690 [Flavobacterium arcticum]|uniref:Uncharacterized protein n=1 Tax=Flavobacterium arcticum TaxID=1784713 RepID=A0A345HEM8_9FLAO|nr:hypothetical protein [Flavobacterium arcticum]AXG75038.1 hypothetical protein DVK85_12690 [Flavobacterium arcticum]KAF2511179.1 hypothetical protein E0W72_07250 [Flavobacterium arcticum]